MPSLDETQKQIQALQQQAAELRNEEIRKVLGVINAAMLQYGITLADLGLRSLRESDAKKQRR